ncbi:MAG: HNH endonuclease [Pseudomonadota bacterium]
MTVTASTIQRFSTAAGGCRLWTGSVSQDGYPYVYDADRRAALGHGKSMVAVRRCVWEKARGPIPAGRVVVLTCRNRLCVVRAHMVLMTHGEARTFAAEAGAYETVACKVSQVANARKRRKLDAAGAERVRARVAAGEKVATIADELGVFRSVVDRIVAGTTYRHVAAPNSSVFAMVA